MIAISSAFFSSRSANRRLLKQIPLARTTVLPSFWYSIAAPPPSAPSVLWHQAHGTEVRGRSRPSMHMWSPARTPGGGVRGNARQARRGPWLPRPGRRCRRGQPMAASPTFGLAPARMWAFFGMLPNRQCVRPIGRCCCPTGSASSSERRRILRSTMIPRRASSARTAPRNRDGVVTAS